MCDLGINHNDTRALMALWLTCHKVWCQAKSTDYLYRQMSSVYSGVARMLKKLRTSKGDYCIKHYYVPFKIETSLKGKNLIPEVSCGMGNHFYHIRWAPLSVTILLSTCICCVMGATPMVYVDPCNCLWEQPMASVRQGMHCRLSQTLLQLWTS